VPLAHGVHCAAPAVAEYVPAAQGEHWAAPGPDVLPSGQGEHEVVPLPGAEVPAAHFVQLAAPPVE
jgi:hypothetical protein